MCQSAYRHLQSIEPYIIVDILCVIEVFSKLRLYLSMNYSYYLSLSMSLRWSLAWLSTLLYSTVWFAQLSVVILMCFPPFTSRLKLFVTSFHRCIPSIVYLPSIYIWCVQFRLLWIASVANNNIIRYRCMQILRYCSFVTTCVISLYFGILKQSISSATWAPTNY